jgi:hypothetical protein
MFYFSVILCVCVCVEYFIQFQSHNIYLILGERR